MEQQTLILVDKHKTKVLQVFDKVDDMYLCYFFYSKRAVWLSKDEVKFLAEELNKDIKGVKNGHPQFI